MEEGKNFALLIVLGIIVLLVMFGMWAVSQEEKINNK
jgi:hypothetical protein